MSISLVSRFKSQFGGFDRRIYILGFGWLVTSTGFAMVIPFISIYFYQELGLSMFAIGLFFGFTAVLRSVPQPFAGLLSDRLGRVPVMGWSQVLRAFTFAGVGLAIIGDAGFWIIATIISLNYLLGAVLHPAANAMVADLVTKEQRIRAFAMLRIGQNLGWALGPMLGGFIAHKSYGALFLVASVVAMISGLFFLFFLKDVSRAKKSEEPSFRITDIIEIRHDKRLFEHCLISFLLFLVVAQFIGPLSVYGVDILGISRRQIGWLFTVNGAMVVLLQFPISHLFRKFRLTHQMALSGLIYAVAYLMIGFATGINVLLVSMIVLTTGEMINAPPSVTLVANLSPADKYGQYMGIYGVFQMAGWSLGPTLGGALFDVFAGQPNLMWPVIAAMAVISSALFINFAKRLDRDINSGLKAGQAENA